MNILFISQNSPFESIGGIERYITNIIDYYKNYQKESRLYLMLPTEKDSYIETDENVIIYYNSNLFLSRNSQANKKEVSRKAQEFSKDIALLIKTDHIDIICAENFHIGIPPAYSLLLSMVTMSLKIPLVLQLHSFATTELQTELINQLKWDKISCVSKSVAGDCFQKGTDINTLSTHYLGVNTNEFNSEKEVKSDFKQSLGLKPNDKIILTATRIILGKKDILKEKGVINLIQAFSKISPRYPNLNLLIAIGKPPNSLKEEFNLAYEMLQGYIKLHNVENHTIIKLFNLDEMVDVYRISDIFALPSENETFGQVFVESMSSGVPVIGTKVGGIPEIISDSYDGFLIPPNDSSILAQKIEMLLNNKGLRDNFIKAGIKTVKEKFTSESQFNNFHKMLQSAVSES